MIVFRPLGHCCIAKIELLSEGRVAIFSGKSPDGISTDGVVGDPLHGSGAMMERVDELQKRLAGPMDGDRRAQSGDMMHDHCDPAMSAPT